MKLHEIICRICQGRKYQLQYGHFSRLSALIQRTDGFDQPFYECPHRRLQPLVVENAHVESLLPVGHGNVADILPLADAVTRNQSDADTGGCQIKGGLHGVDGAYDVHLTADTAGPVAKAVFCAVNCFAKASDFAFRASVDVSFLSY